MNGSVTVTNRCQHEALKKYLSIIPSIEYDYNSKVRQCLLNNNFSGDALQNTFEGLVLSKVAKELSHRPWSTFLTVARGVAGGLIVNNANAILCVEGVHSEIDGKIFEAHRTYVDEFRRPCN